MLLSVLGLIQCAQAYVIHLVQQVEVDGAIVETIDQMVETGDGYTTSNATDRAGYIFTHWSTSTVQEKAVAVTRTPQAEPISLAETRRRGEFESYAGCFMKISLHPIGEGHPF